MKYVTRSNPGSGQAYEIPAFVACLIEDVFGGVTAGRARHGLRWESGGLPMFFLYKITPNDCWIYVLPTGQPSWKTDAWANDVIARSGAVSCAGSAGYRKGNRDHLEIPHVKWIDVALIVPHLVTAISREYGSSV